MHPLPKEVHSCLVKEWFRLEMSMPLIDCSRIVGTMASTTSVTTMSMATMMALTVASPLGSTIHGVNAMLLSTCSFVLELSQPMHISHLCQKERASTNKIAWQLLINNGLGRNEFSILALDGLEKFLHFLVIRVMLVCILSYARY